MTIFNKKIGMELESIPTWWRRRGQERVNFTAFYKRLTFKNRLVMRLLNVLDFFCLIKNILI